MCGTSLQSSPLPPSTPADGGLKRDYNSVDPVKTLRIAETRTQSNCKSILHRCLSHAHQGCISSIVPSQLLHLRLWRDCVSIARSKPAHDHTDFCKPPEAVKAASHFSLHIACKLGHSLVLCIQTLLWQRLRMPFNS